MTINDAEPVAPDTSILVEILTEPLLKLLDQHAQQPSLVLEPLLELADTLIE